MYSSFELPTITRFRHILGSYRPTEELDSYIVTVCLLGFWLSILYLSIYLFIYIRNLIN